MDTPNRAAQYFEARRREEKITARSHRRPKVAPRPGWTAARTPGVPRVNVGPVAAVAAAQTMAALYRKHEPGMEAAAERFVWSRPLPRMWAIRAGIMPDKAGWVKGQLVKASLYRVIVMIVSTGANIRQALGLHWNRAELGEPPSDAEIMRMAADFRASLG